MLKQGPLSGQTLGGKYLLGELLGKGGFGAVYQAENQLLHRQQAVKVLLEEHFSDEKFRDRFLREARTLGALDHANIVHVDDIGMEGNVIYLVMPYISGGTLQDIMKAPHGPLRLEQITRYLEQICSALGYAHAQGIVHLDLKPLNLLVHKDGRLLLSDFGLAHLMEQGAIEGGTSLSFGSPLYMAPEHFEGRPEQRGDLYALGVILYQMLAGRHPFEASTPAAVMRKHLTEPPPPLQSARPDLPAALDAVLAKALAKQPEQRYGRAGELLFDFRAALGGQTLQFASADEPTQRSQAYLDPTMRASQPPVSPAGPTLVGSGLATPVPGGQPFVYQAPPPGFYSPGVPRPVSVPMFALGASGKLNIWTQGFTWLFVLAAVVGVMATYLAVSGVKELDSSSVDTTGGDQIVLAVQCLLGVVSLVGLRFTRARLVRIGLVLQAGAMIASIVASVLLLRQDASFDPNFPYIVFAHLGLAQGILTLGSLLGLSYGLAGWRRPQDMGFTILQVLLSIGLAIFIMHTVSAFFDFGPDLPGIELGIGLASNLLATAVVLLRPAVWEQNPALTIFLAAAGVASLIDAYGYFGGPFFLHNFTIPQLYGISLAAYMVFNLGLLLLIQTERVRKSAQQVSAPALAGPKV